MVYQEGSRVQNIYVSRSTTSTENQHAAMYVGTGTSPLQLMHIHLACSLHENILNRNRSNLDTNIASSEWRTPLSDLEAGLPVPLGQLLVIAVQHDSYTLWELCGTPVAMATRFP